MRIENYPGFLGTFDHISWWKSQPLAGIDTILDVCWVYGEHHICAARMIDGSYTIWQSNDFGNNWNIVLTTSERIYCIIRPDAGRALASTSGGWWRSDNAGRSWTKVSTQAPNCHTVKEITNDILVALDGTYIWRSADTGTTWTQAVIAETFPDEENTPTDVIITAITNYPTIDGTALDLIVGCTDTNAPKLAIYPQYVGYSGPFSLNTFHDTDLKLSEYTKAYKDIILYSSDGGISFFVCPPNSGWSFRESTCSTSPGIRSQNVAPTPGDRLDWRGDHNYDDGNGWQIGQYAEQQWFYHTFYTPIELFPRDTYNDIITDIEMTGINKNGLPQFIIQVKMSDGILRHYWVRKIHYMGAYNYFWSIAKFDAYNTPGGKIASSEVNIIGTTLMSRMAIFSGMNANNEPLIKTSTDGGENWTDVAPSTAPMYTGPDMDSRTNNPFIDDVYIQYSTHQPMCSNFGYIIDAYHYSKQQSYDMDAKMGDLVPRAVTYGADALIGGPAPTSYLMAGRILQFQTKTYANDGIVAIDKSKTYLVDALTEKLLRKTYYVGGSIEGVDTTAYNMGGLLVSDEFPPFEIPQGFNVRKPTGTECCEYPFDSRNM